MNAMLTMAAVAARLGVPVTTLRNWIYCPKAKVRFPRPTVVAKQRAGRKGYWQEAEVEAWEKSHVR